MSAAATSDLADWLPPMLVKELRQGLRTHAFLGVFILAQIALVGLAVARLYLVGDDWPETLDAWFHSALLVLIVGLMPLRGLAAINEETRSSNLDLVRLTHISTPQLVWSKWASLAGQTVLLLISILPYIVLRYFHGSYDIVPALQACGWMLASSLALTALCMVISASGFWARIITLGVAAIPFVALGFAWIERGSTNFVSGGGPPFIVFLTPLAAGVPFLLAIACQRIPPGLISQSAIVRFIPFVVVSVMAASQWRASRAEPEGYMVLMGPFILWSITEAISEPSVTGATSVARWNQGGALRRLTGPFVFPGWQAGSLYAMMITAFAAASMALALYHVSGEQAWWSCKSLLLLGIASAFPALLRRMLPRAFSGHWICSLTHAFGVGLFIAAMTSTPYGRDSMMPSFFPTSAFLSTFGRLWPWMAPRSTPSDYVTSLMSIVVFIALLITRRSFDRELQDMDAEATLTNY